MVTPWTSALARPSRFLALLGAVVLLAFSFDPVAAAEADPPSDGDEDVSEELEPKAESPGEKAFWEAVLLLGSDDAAAQRRGRDRLLEAGDLEYPTAQCYLGECFLRGQDGFAKNERKAVDWFRLAADRGDVTARVYLGTSYLLGTGVRKDRGKARAALQQAVEAAGAYVPPSPPSWYRDEWRKLQEARPKAVGVDGETAAGPVTLGSQAAPWEILLARGHFVLGLLKDEDRDLTGALALFEAAASWGAGGRAGIYEAALRAARCYALGRGCTRDLDRANRLLEKSRDLARANTMAQFHSMWTLRKVDDFTLADLEKVTGTLADAQLAQEQQNVTASLLKENPAEAIRWCEMAAEAGEGWAMLELAEILRTGRAGRTDTAGAFEWYRKAVDAGKSWVATGNLTICYLKGIGTEKDESTAADLVRKYGDFNFACALAGAGLTPGDTWTGADWWALLETQSRKAGMPLAQFHTARNEYSQIISENEWAVSPNKRRGVLKQMRRAAKEGIPAAHYYIGDMMRRGWEGRVPAGSIESEFESGAEKGDVQCMIDYANILANKGGGFNLRKAIQINSKILERDPEDSSAHNNIAVEYGELSVLGISVDGIKDLDAAAIEHLERAEELGSSVAAKNLAWRYYNGFGVERDLRMAYTYFQSAAEKGDTEANRILGKMHEVGEGVPVTPREAMYYYRIAALDGDFDALKSVCDFYLQGRGVARDLEAAQIWLVRLFQRGHVGALFAYGDVLLQRKEYKAARSLWNDLRESSDTRMAGVAYDRLACIYGDGLGVKKDERKAAKFTQAAIDRGNADAICRRARDFIVGGKVAEAVQMLEALEDRSGEALCLLGSIRIAGQGVPRDIPTGLKNMRDSASLGHLNAKYLLAAATAGKIPGAPSIDEALRLLEEAEAGGHSKARALRDKLSAVDGGKGKVPQADGGRARSG